MHSHGVVATVLARELVDLARAERIPGPFMAIPQEAVLGRWSQLLGRRYRFLRPLLKRVVGEFASARYLDESAVAQFLCGDSRFVHHVYKHEVSISWSPGCGPSMRPIGRAADWKLPELTNFDSLAEWLDISPARLGWLADSHGRERGLRESLRRYHYRVHCKRSGGIRIIEAPKALLRRLQRKILKQIIQPIPCHEAAHGFEPGRSTKTCAAPHVGRSVVLTMDLKDFFLSVPTSHVFGLFKTVGYPPVVAVSLTALCTNRTPDDVVSAARGNAKRRLYLAEPREEVENGPDQRCEASHEALQATTALYRSWHLPQGAPTSPSLANRCFYTVDQSIGDYCRAAGVTYTRYADDLTFSSSQVDWTRSSQRFANQIAAILLRFGYRTHHRKTRIRSSSQRQTVTGVVVNERLNCDRREYDVMKAILFNCVRHGPASQNRDNRRNFRSHLEGRIGHVAHLNPARGAKLRALFAQIQW